MLAILKAPESIGRYEGMDLDLKGGRTRRQGQLGGLEVGRAISEPSVAQWLTGAIQPTAVASTSAVSGFSIVSTYNLIGICLTRLPKQRLVLPLIRISNDTITTRYYRRFKKRFTTFVPGNAYPFHQLISSKSVRFLFLSRTIFIFDAICS